MMTTASADRAIRASERTDERWEHYRALLRPAARSSIKCRRSVRHSEKLSHNKIVFPIASILPAICSACAFCVPLLFFPADNARKTYSDLLPLYLKISFQSVRKYPPRRGAARPIPIIISPRGAECAWRICTSRYAIRHVARYTYVDM